MQGPWAPATSIIGAVMTCPAGSRGLHLSKSDACGGAGTKDVVAVLVDPSVVESGSSVGDECLSVYGGGVPDEPDGCGSVGGAVGAIGGVRLRS